LRRAKVGQEPKALPGDPFSEGVSGALKGNLFPWKTPCIEGACLKGFGAIADFPPHNLSQIDGDDGSNAVIGVQVEKAYDLHLDSHLLARLPSRGFLDRFSEVHISSRNGPPPAGGFDASANQIDLLRVFLERGECARYHLGVEKEDIATGCANRMIAPLPGDFLVFQSARASRAVAKNFSWIGVLKLMVDLSHGFLPLLLGQTPGWLSFG
jgi:hypothetical protein